MSLTPALGTKTALTVTGLSTLASGAKVLSDELDATQATLNGLGMSIDVTLGIATGEAEFVDVMLIGSNTTATYGSTDDIKNPTFLGKVDMDETTPKINIQLADLPPFFKLLFVNNCSVALTSGTVDFIGKSVQNA